MSTVKELLKIACLAALLAMLCMIGLHLRGWLRGIDNLQSQAQTTAGSIAAAADTSNLASTEMLDTIGSANKLIDAVQNKTLPKVNGTLDAATGTLNKATTLETLFGKESAQVAETLQVDTDNVTDKLDAAIDAVITIPPAVTAALAPLPKLELSLMSTSDEAKGFIAGPLTFATSNAGELEDTMNLTVEQGRERWVAPWDGKHKVKHYGMLTLGYVGLGATLLRDAK